LTVLIGMAQPYQFVQEREDHRDAAGLLIVLPGSGFGISIARPGIGGWIEVAFGG
jgi:hypothetical protein